MDAHVTSILLEQIKTLAGDVGRLNQKLDDLAAHQGIQSEIQLEAAKAIHLLRNEQQVLAGALQDALGGPNSEPRTSAVNETKELRRLLEGVAAHQANEINVLKQTCNIIFRQSHNGRQRFRCIFLVHSIPMWDALADVYCSMVRDDRFEPIVISINSSPLGRGVFTGEEAVSQFLQEQGIPHLRFNMGNSYEGLDILKSLGPTIIFRQQQWDGCLPPAFRTQELTFARLCLVPYGMTIVTSFGDHSGDGLTPLAFDQQYHRAAWKVFCENEISCSYYRSFNHSDPEKFVVSGYPKLDRLLQAKGKGIWPLEERNGRTFRVVWAPHYSLGENGPGFGVFNLIWKDMLDWAKKAPDIQFVLKPHPALFREVINAEAVTSFRKLWLSQPNCGIEEGLYGELFDASDVLVTDGISFLTEYHLFGKPLVFFDSGHHAPFNSLGKMAEACSDRVRSFEELRAAVLEYKRGKKWGYEAERAKLLEVLLPNDEPAANYILGSIAEGLRTSSFGT